ncbi:MAG: 2-succinyl-5-enolpyruvyl-6-hydroxy-3-cyclohexene-1-carboxylic-acid synthase [Phycisphaeraceae bacterium]|nr:2-succinyl-5-enolpyruvyl-6-hydroxy-3-cyclohexene-1-carboxylic-acid synthase [Phycisphaeraceae bacterium]
MTDNLNTSQARLIVTELARAGVELFCISPGSRSTPLVVAAARQGRVRVQVCHDERGSGFLALGYARATGRPAVIITTSGTAAANLLPAVCEASMSRLPMLILTADRPEELTDTGANQTMIQPGLYGQYVRWQFDLPCPSPGMGAGAVLSTVDHAIGRALGVDPGPVHLNCRFREPLEPVDLERSEAHQAYMAPVEAWARSDRCFSVYERPKLNAAPDAADEVAALINDGDRGMIIAGSLHHESERAAVRRLIERSGWATYVDINSGLRFGGPGTNLIRHFDPESMNETFYRNASPEVVIHFGSATTSKRLGQFLSRVRPRRHIVIKPGTARYDPVQTVTWQVQADIAMFAQRVVQRLGQMRAGELAAFHRLKAEAAQRIIEDVTEAEARLTEPWLIRHLSRVIDPGHALFVSNSMPIRDADLYSVVDGPAIPVGTNRGVSGVDGIIATSCGYARGLGRPVTLVIGDIAALHDLSSMGLAAASSPPVIMVIINNRGGSIFDFLPISSQRDVFEPYFITPHEQHFAGVAEMFNMRYFRADGKAEFADAYDRVTRSITADGGRSSIIEVVTERALNFEIRKLMKQRILQAILS